MLAPWRDGLSHYLSPPGPPARVFSCPRTDTGNDPLTVSGQVPPAISRAVERRQSSIVPVHRCGLAVAVAQARPGPIRVGYYHRSGNEAGPPQVSACGCGEGVPEYRFGSQGQPVCILRWLNCRVPFSAYDPEITTAPWQDGQRLSAIT